MNDITKIIDLSKLEQIKLETNNKINIYYATIFLFQDYIYFFIKNKDCLFNLLLKLDIKSQKILFFIDTLTSTKKKLDSMKNSLKFCYEDFERKANLFFYKDLKENELVNLKYI